MNTSTLIQREDPSRIIDHVKDRLDFSQCKRLLLEVENKARRNDLEDAIHNAVNRQIEAAIYLGWDAAKNPASWIFKGGDPANGLSDEDPGYVFWQRVQELGNPDVDATTALDDATTLLLIEAGQSAFAYGWQLASDLSWLIFNKCGEQ